MADPLEALRRPIVPLDPDPSFTIRLRSHLERALVEGDEVMPALESPSRTESTNVTPPADGDIAFFSLHVPSADRARAFYGEVLGWRFGDPMEPGGYDRIVNLSLPGGVWDGEGVPGVPNPGVHLVRHVADLAASSAKVRALGGTASEPEVTPYGSRARCTDDQGNGFALLQHPPGVAQSAQNGERPGDLAYITIAPGDEQLAATFYGGLFGWQFRPGSVEHALQVEGPTPQTGMWGGTGRPNVMLMYRVDDVAVAVAKVRALGGEATDPAQMPYGVTSDCVDDQGMAFYLGQL
ncbi:MAG TPA: VOC family protein [Mycobacteriales bacterium]|jgi:predicted enzyme related to lactoylglutathione lyase|nr:VOC family protein [Mycobacteriales bacterium]